MSGDKEIFLPNDKNLTRAFEGTDIELPAKNIARKLLSDHVVTRIPLTGDVFSYCCRNTGTSIDSTPFIKDAKNKSTKELLFKAGGELRNSIELSGALKARYSLAYATVSDFDNEVKKANNPDSAGNKLYALVTIARDESERVTLQKKIRAFYEANADSNAVAIDAANSILGEAEYNEFVENCAMALAIGNSDINQRKTYEGYADEVLKNWAKKIKSGDFYVYSRYEKDGDRAVNFADLTEKLKGGRL